MKKLLFNVFNCNYDQAVKVYVILALLRDSSLYWNSVLKMYKYGVYNELWGKDIRLYLKSIQFKRESIHKSKKSYCYNSAS